MNGVNGVNGVAVSADGRMAVSGGSDGTVRVWDLAGTAAPRVLTGHAGPVNAVAVSADGRTAVSGSADGTVRVWDLAGDAAPRVLTGHAGEVNAVAVSADGRIAVSGGDDGTVRVWDLAGDAAPRVLTGQPVAEVVVTSYNFQVNPVAVSADGPPRGARTGPVRHDQCRTGRDPAPATPPAAAGTALGVLAAVLERDGQQRSATQARHQALADADHLALLHAIWTAETSPAREQRYRDLLAAALPPGCHARPGPRGRWLWRTRHTAELAAAPPPRSSPTRLPNGTSPRRDITAVIDARIRNRIGSLVPLPPGQWSARVPVIADPERRAYVTEIAALMDARQQRLGEHAAACAPPWAVSVLGPVPEQPAARLGWQRRAASIAAWRELSGYHHPADPIGPEPAAATPDLRAAWHEALAALGPVDGADVRGMPDGLLLHLRDTYPVETAWAPQYVGDELRQVRDAAWDARLTSLRVAADARAAQLRGDHRQATELARLMAARGVGVRELARMVPCNPGHISNLRSGKARPSPELAEVLDERLEAGGWLCALVPAHERRRPQSTASWDDGAAADEIAALELRPPPGSLRPPRSGPAPSSGWSWPWTSWPSPIPVRHRPACTAGCADIWATSAGCSTPA